MDSTNTKKREGTQILSTELSIHLSKRVKRKHADFTVMFLKVISLLSEEKKNIIRNIGFGSILSFSCSSNVNDIFMWLVKHFNAASSTITLSNGFSFTITPSFVYKVLGLPFGTEHVKTTSSKEDCDIIFETIRTDSPTVEYLCSLLSTEMDEISFTRVFMLLLLDVVIAPSSSAFPSQLYYHNLINVTAIPNLDWCSFSLAWLQWSIEHYQSQILKGIHQEIGGCKLILVIPYFEFLITSEFNLGNSLPRLPLWTTNVVNSFIALDSLQQGSELSFGRLARKHISSTIFQRCSQPSIVHLPDEIKDHIKTRMPRNALTQEQVKFQTLAENFYRKMVHNSIPLVKTYIDDIINACSLADQEDATVENESEKILYAGAKEDLDKCVLQMFDQKIPILHVPQEQQPQLTNDEIQIWLKNLYSTGNLKDDDVSSSNLTMHELIQNFSTSCSTDDSVINLDLPNCDAIEKSLYPQSIENSYLMQLQSEQSTGMSEFLKMIELEIIDSIVAERQARHLNRFELQNRPWENYLPHYFPAEEREGNIIEFNNSITCPRQATKADEMFLYSNQRDNRMKEVRTPEIPVHSSPQIQGIFNTNTPHSAPVVIPSSKENMFSPRIQPHSAQIRKVTEFQYHRKCTNKTWGSSLNDRLKGTKTPSKIGLVSFDLDDEDDPQDGQPIVPHAFQIKTLHQTGKELMESEQVVINPQKLDDQFMKAGSIHSSKELPTEQVIFATALEHEFYTTLMQNKLNYSPRIFEISKIWVDQRTLTFSMSEGGWINPRVMDCFGKLSNVMQIEKLRREGRTNNKDIVRHIVIKDTIEILMNPQLNHSDPQYKLLFGVNNVGYRLENAGLVHIPCPHDDRSWILIVANFIDKSFDVLNPDHSIEKFQSIVNTVIFNFKNLFINSYPGCASFNIREFPVRHIKVPKHNFRYDSGIFVIQFIRWFCGIQVKHFSNADVQAIREKITCQLVINKFNEHQVPVATQFMARHAPHLLHGPLPVHPNSSGNFH